VKPLKAFLLLVVFGVMTFGTVGCRSDDDDAELKIDTKHDKIKVDVDD
jgi:hypothetical protein